MAGEIFRVVDLMFHHLYNLMSIARTRRWAGGNRVEWAGPETLAGCGRLAWLDLRRNPLSRLHPRSLDRLPNLDTLSVFRTRFVFLFLIYYVF